MKVICIANQKGGATKTTTAGALCSMLTKDGFSVLAIDMDPQANLSDSFGVRDATKKNTYTMLKGLSTPEETIQSSNEDTAYVCDIVPSIIDLALFEQEPHDIGRDYVLKEILENSSISERYDFVVIDTPPSLGVTTTVALVASDLVLIPTVTSSSATKGITQLYKHLESVKKYLNKNLRVIGVLMTMFKKNTKIAKEIRETVKILICDPFNIKLYDSTIRESVRVPESQAFAIDLWNFAPDSTVAADYDAWYKNELKEDLVNG